MTSGDCDKELGLFLPYNYFSAVWSILLPGVFMDEADVLRVNMEGSFSFRIPIVTVVYEQ
jgi:hypothetical protein